MTRIKIKFVFDARVFDSLHFNFMIFLASSDSGMELVILVSTGRGIDSTTWKLSRVFLILQTLVRERPQFRAAKILKVFLIKLDIRVYLWPMTESTSLCSCNTDSIELGCLVSI